MQHFWRVMINNIPASASRGALIFASLVKNFKIVSKPTGIRLDSVRRTSRGEECDCYLSPVVEVSVPLQCLQNINGSDIVDSKKANGYCWALAMFFSSRKSEIVPTSLSKGLKYYICTGSCWFWKISSLLDLQLFYKPDTGTGYPVGSLQQCCGAQSV